MGYDLGGVSTSSKREPEHGKQQRLQGGKEPHCLYPGDLYPFTRKPLFVVVDSDNSFVFQQIPRYFGQPLMVLMSPQDAPPGLRDLRHAGSLFTLFLHSPLAAFCLICNVASLPIHHWERCQRYVEQFLIEASRLVVRSRCGESTHPRRAFEGPGTRAPRRCHCARLFGGSRASPPSERRAGSAEEPQTVMRFAAIRGHCATAPSRGVGG